jgi:hypothetical protein
LVFLILTELFLSGPANLLFYVDDIEDEWVFESKFDYIHSRMMCVGVADWDRYLQRCYE